jgi:hypothetical protein
MLRRFLFLGIAVLALVCTIGLPGRANAHHGRGGSYDGYYKGYYPHSDGAYSRPYYGGTVDSQFDRGSSARIFNRGFGGFFRRGSGSRNGAGSNGSQFYVGLS